MSRLITGLRHNTMQTLTVDAFDEGQFISPLARGTRKQKRGGSFY